MQLKPKWLFCLYVAAIYIIIHLTKKRNQKSMSCSVFVSFIEGAQEQGALLPYWNSAERAANMLHLASCQH